MQIGDKLPLFLQLFDYANNKYVKAFVQDVNGDPIAGSPVELALVDASGLYGNTTLLFPDNTPWVLAKYAVYDDSGYTVLSGSEGGATDTFYYTPAPQQSVDGVVGVIQC